MCVNRQVRENGRRIIRCASPIQSLESSSLLTRSNRACRRLESRCMLRSMQSKLFFIVAGWLAVSAPLLAQPYAQADIQYGARLFGQQCTVCHGATGDVVAGVDLRNNRFKRSSSDFDL